MKRARGTGDSYEKKRSMNSRQWQSVVLMVLAIVGAMAILGLVGMWLMHLFFPSAATGGISAVAGGVSGRVFATALVLVLVVIGFLLWRRRKQ